MENGAVYLEFVLDKLKQRIQKINQSLAEGQREIENMHEYYWDNYTEMDQYGYEDFDNQQALLTQINTNQDQLKMKFRLKKMLDTPYFGRVDFRYEDEEDSESFYIGIGNFAESAGKVPLIYDWRAPVSSLFYDYDKGPASYESPGGMMEGEVTSRWQYKIRRGKLIYEFESDVKIDDEILKAQLGANGDVQLKNIVRTIQREQNAIIRNTKDRILVIQGAAGSGKTSVALHRIAYLLYHDRKNLKSSNILILSPNSVFSDYISHILPELGEENIQEMSFDLFAYRELQDVVNDCEDRYDQMEKKLSGGANDEIGRREEEKQSESFLEEMEGYLLMLEDELMNFRDVEFRSYRLTAGRIISLFYEKFLDLPLLSRMDAIADYAIDEYETLIGKDLEEEVREEFAGKFLSMYETRDLYIIYSRFLEFAGYGPLPHRQYQDRMLSYEDVYPMLYMKYRLQAPRKNHQIKHLVIDEMQDYSRLQYLILERLFPCRMTILGDRAQTMDEKTQDVTRFLPKILGKDIHMLEMKRSYRNTVEVATYAAAITGIEDLDLFQRHGKPVVEEFFPFMEQALETIEKELDLERFETAAILTMTQQEVRRVKEALEKRGVEANYIDRDSSTFVRGLTVTTFYLAKGLEFDQVFTLYEAGKDSGLLRQARYICATRALHELYMYQIAGKGC